MRCRCGGAEKGLRFTSRVNVEVQSMCIGAEDQVQVQVEVQVQSRCSSGGWLCRGAGSEVQRCRCRDDACA